MGQSSQQLRPIRHHVQLQYATALVLSEVWKTATRAGGSGKCLVHAKRLCYVVIHRTVLVRSGGGMMLAGESKGLTWERTQT